MTNLRLGWLKKRGREAVVSTDSIVSAAEFQRLHERTHISIYRFVYSLTGGPATVAEDITADTYLRAWKSRKKFRPISAITFEQATNSWLLKIARNLVYDHARRVAGGELVELERVQLTDIHPHPEQLAISADEQALLLELLRGLPSEHAEMVVLRYVLGWPVEEIGAHVDKTPNAVYVAIHRAIKVLRARWPQGEGSNG